LQTRAWQDLQCETAHILAVVILSPNGLKEQDTLTENYCIQSVPFVIRVMRNEQLKGKLNELKVQAAGCAFLSAMCSIGGDTPGFLIENGVIDVIILSMTMPGDDKRIVRAGTWALWKLSASWKSAKGGISVPISTFSVP
jgi:hypothetical protein